MTGNAAHRLIRARGVCAARGSDGDRARSTRMVLVCSPTYSNTIISSIPSNTQPSSAACLTMRERGFRRNDNEPFPPTQWDTPNTSIASYHLTIVSLLCSARADFAISTCAITPTPTINLQTSISPFHVHARPECRQGEGSERSALQAYDLIPNGELDRGD